MKGWAMNQLAEITEGEEKKTTVHRRIEGDKWEQGNMLTEQ